MIFVVKQRGEFRLRKVLFNVSAFFAVIVAALMASVAPANASASGCQGQCTTGVVWRNASGYFIDVHVEMNDENGLWCTWVLRDYDTKVVVGSGKTYDITSKRITGLYNRYQMTVSNHSCYGWIENE